MRANPSIGSLAAATKPDAGVRPREVLMRILALAILTTVTALTTTLAAAQTYGGNSPICLQSYGLGGGYNIDCSYASMEQCQATASGLSATCLTNPYYAKAQMPRGPISRQPRGGY